MYVLFPLSQLFGVPGAIPIALGCLGRGGEGVRAAHPCLPFLAQQCPPVYNVPMTRHSTQHVVVSGDSDLAAGYSLTRHWVDCA